MTTSLTEDFAFCEMALPRVSRSFALSIQALPKDLRDAVGVAYLLCRVVDTVEDDPRFARRRDPHFDRFDRALDEAARATDAASAAATDFVSEATQAGLGATEAEVELIAGAASVFRVYGSLPAASRAAVFPHVAEMSKGMREYAARADEAPSLRRLRDLADLERYCYYVAGTVGGLLTSLFMASLPEATQRTILPPGDAQAEARLRERATSFGLGLQLVNIVKDIAGDFERGDCFMPESVAREHGFVMEDLLAESARRPALAAVRQLCERARKHLDAAVEYTLFWKATDEGRDAVKAVRLFCAVPLALAYATLREVEDGRDTLRVGRAPTVSRALVGDVFGTASAKADDDEALVALFERCRRGAIGRTARPPEPAGASGGAPPASTEDDARVTDSNVKVSASGMETKQPGLQPERSFDGKVFVTGGAGHLGANLVHRLLAEGRDVRVLLEPTGNNAAIDAIEAATGKKLDRFMGDLRDPIAMNRALEGCETAFHVAARVSTLDATSQGLRDLYDVNVIGTANLLAAARKQSVKRVVVSGSFSAVGYDAVDPSKAADESVPFYPFDEHLPYGRTKVQVEHEALKAVVDGLDVVIATSCAILGPWDYIPSRMGRTLCDFANGKLGAYLPGGFEFVAAKDIADGHVRAMSRGRTGQKYILSTEFLTVDQIMDIFEEVSGRPRPKLRLPAGVMAQVANVSHFVLSTFFPQVPQRFTPGAVRILRMQRHADTTKAETELGYKRGDIRAAIHEAYADFARRGLVPKGPTSVAAAATSPKIDRDAKASEKEAAA